MGLDTPRPLPACRQVKQLSGKSGVELLHLPDKPAGVAEKKIAMLLAMFLLAAELSHLPDKPDKPAGVGAESSTRNWHRSPAMARAFLAFTFAALWSTDAWAGQPRVVPVGPPPEVALAAAVLRDNSVLIELAVPQLVPETRAKVIERDGKRETVTYTVMRAVMTTSTFTADGERVAVFRKSGAKVAAAELPKLLAKQTAIVLFRHRGSELPAAPDPYYVQVLRDDVVILVLRQEAL